MVDDDDFGPEPSSYARRLLDTVLVVDDDDEARQSLRELLEEHGYPVIEAANGQQALNLLVSQSRPHVGLIVLDLKMPVMDGHEFLRVLQSYVRLATIPVVVVSGNTRDLDAGERSRIIASFQIPFLPTQLLDMVGAFVSH